MCSARSAAVITIEWLRVLMPAAAAAAHVQVHVTTPFLLLPYMATTRCIQALCKSSTWSHLCFGFTVLANVYANFGACLDEHHEKFTINTKINPAID